MARQDGRARDARGLTVRQARFVTEYLKDHNATRAAERAGFAPGKSASVQGTRLLAHARVRAAIDEAIARRRERVEVKADDVLRELLRLARSDIGEAFDESGSLKPLHLMPEDVRRAISSVKVEEKKEGRGKTRRVVGQVKEVRFWDKNKGLETLAKHLGLLREKLEVTGRDGGPVQHQVQDDLTGYTDAELEQLEAIHEARAARLAGAQPGGGEGGEGAPPEGT